MSQLIVHADDLGLSRSINDGIFEAHRRGVLTSASIMANGEAFHHAVDICRTTPTLDTGVHLTLVEERPILAPEKVKSLIDANGRFHRHATQFTRKYFQGGLSFDEIRQELEVQVTRVLDHGILVSHLDSHQHLHMLPRILAITVELAKKYGIRAVRIPNEPVRLAMLTGDRALTRALQGLALRFFCHLGRNIDLVHTDAFAGFFFGGKLNRENLLKVLENLPPQGTCELMCHPGQEDPHTRHDHWGYNWNDELEALTDPTIPLLLERKGIRLISYRELS